MGAIITGRPPEQIVMPDGRVVEPWGLFLGACSGGEAMHRKTLCPSHNKQAQDTVVGLLKKSLSALPTGTVLHATRYGVAGSNSFCDDNDTKPSSPKHFQTNGEVKLPAGTDPAAMVSRVGETWRSRGWRVEERDGFHKPNQFGYGPDGYRLQIIVAAREGYPPTLQASTPYFPGTIARDDVDFPMQLEA